MDLKVITFPQKPKESLGWICGCGGDTWTLFANGDCLCTSCGYISTVIKVVRAADSAPDDLQT